MAAGRSGQPVLSPVSTRNGRTYATEFRRPRHIFQFFWQRAGVNVAYLSEEAAGKTFMNHSQPDIKTIFGKALDIDSDAARAAFLDAACAGNEPLRAEVVSLLAAFHQA